MNTNHFRRSGGKHCWRAGLPDSGWRKMIFRRTTYPRRVVPRAMQDPHYRRAACRIAKAQGVPLPIKRRQVTDAVFARRDCPASALPHHSAQADALKPRSSRYREPVLAYSAEENLAEDRSTNCAAKMPVSPAHRIRQAKEKH